MASSEAEFIGNIDMTVVAFGPAEKTQDGATKVPMYRNASSTQKNNKFSRISLCADAVYPMLLRYPLDAVRDDNAGSARFRRGLSVTIDDPRTIAALKALDERIIAAAVENSKEWFKKPLKDVEVRARYKPTCAFAKEGDENESIKIKVKCPGVEYPTVLHTRDADGRYRKKCGRIDDLTWNARVVPIVSASYGLWFMGGGSQFGVTFQAEEMIVIPGEEARETLAQFPSSVPLEMATDEVATDENAECASSTPTSSYEPFTTTTTVSHGIILEDDGNGD